MLNNEEILKLERLLYLRDIEKSKNSLLDFTKQTMEDFDCQSFHETYYNLLDKFAKGDIKNLIVTMPPQHGKSEGSTRRLPAYILGKNPDTKIAVASYNATFASKFNRDIQRILDDPIYNDIFPETTLNATNVVSGSTNYLRNSVEFEIVGKKGGLKAVGRGGALTGNKVDVMIMDDLYKDYLEGNSPIIRDNVIDWYNTVVKTRLHNKSKQLIVFTRWHEEDLIGYLESKGKVKQLTDLNNLPNLAHDEWLKINFEAIKTEQKQKIDSRNKGEALWESVHSRKSLMSSMELEPEKFNCLYQGNPTSKDGLLYSKFKTYKQLPQLKQVKNYTDTADTGQDNLCSIVYGLPLSSTDDHIYVLDVLYTDEPMEITEPKTINLINKNNVNVTLVESNNGGRSFARIVKDGVVGHVKWFHQSGNKEARIFSNSASVNNRIVFPDDWHIRWNDFYNAVTKYKKLFKANKFNDAPDVLTGIIEEESTNKGKYDIR